MGLLAEKRHRYILDKLSLNGRIHVPEIAKELAVTEVTIRRDLAALEKNGLLKKTYGGAVFEEKPDIDVSVHFRQTRNLNAKKIVGKLASKLIKNGDNIYLEAGSTCNEIIPYLSEYNSLTIIVNSLHLMSRLHEQIQHKVIITGGHYRPRTMDMIGPSAQTAIEQLAGFTAFTGADDISIDAGISGADVATVAFTKLVLKKASKVIFVGDHTKFDNPALYKIADLDRLDYIVTDTAPNEDWHSLAREKNIQLIYPSAEK